MAQEIADRVRGPEGWCLRLRGYAMAHGSNDQGLRFEAS
jgi:hypothetical protein